MRQTKKSQLLKNLRQSLRTKESQEARPEIYLPQLQDMHQIKQIL